MSEENNKIKKLEHELKELEQVILFSKFSLLVSI
jgi:hypothetical protein